MKEGIRIHVLREKGIRHFADRSITIRGIFFILSAIVCLTPFISPPVALLAGILIAQWMGHPFMHLNHKLTQILLQVSIIGLGFGMNIHQALKAGKAGILFSMISIVLTMVTGFMISRLLKIEKKTAYLISAGTAVCGGSAIAAIAPVIKAEEQQTTVALGTVFIFNAVALLLFPGIGHLLHLSQTQFGWWSAIAIHDTSSVVGASSRYGVQALELATTVKLARALWIIPVTLTSMLFFKSNNQHLKFPYFIALFLLAMLYNTYFSSALQFGKYILYASRAGLTLTLFLIGSGMSKKTLSSVGIRPMLLGILLWLVVSVTSLWMIDHLHL